MANLQQLHTQTVLNLPENVCNRDGKEEFYLLFYKAITENIVSL